MKGPLDLFSWDGRVTRSQYLLAGLALTLLKFAVDLGVASAFGELWTPVLYVAPGAALEKTASPYYWWVLFVAALPFLAAGLSLSARRLRDMGARPFWAGLFLAPYFHHIFFVVLLLAPSASEPRAPEPAATPVDEPEAPLFPLLAQLVPDGEGARFTLGVVVAMVIAAVGIGILMAGDASAAGLPGREVLGVGLFFGLPFGMGFWSAFIASYRRVAPSILLALLGGQVSVFATLAALLALRVEGVACLVMAWPIFASAAVLGSLVGHLSARLPAPAASSAAALLLVALLVGHDRVAPPPPYELVAVTEVHVAAPPEVVWRNVTAVSPIDEAPEPVFAICAMPLASTLDGRGVGARRRCKLTVGDLEETVTAWDEGRELTFRVDRAPPQFAEIGAVEQGQFLLRREADGTTTVRGTTWYRCQVGPRFYWSLWTQSFVHAVHRRVLAHVKRLSEHPELPPASAPAAQPRWMRLSNETCRCTRHAAEPGP